MPIAVPASRLGCGEAEPSRDSSPRPSDREPVRHGRAGAMTPRRAAAAASRPPRLPSGEGAGLAKARPLPDDASVEPRFRAGRVRPVVDDPQQLPRRGPHDLEPRRPPWVLLGRVALQVPGALARCSHSGQPHCHHSRCGSWSASSSADRRALRAAWQSAHSSSAKMPSTSRNGPSGVPQKAQRDPTAPSSPDHRVEKIPPIRRRPSVARPASDTVAASWLR